MRSPTTVLLGLAGLAWTGGQAVLPDMGTSTQERYAAVLAHPVAQAWSAALLMVAAVLLVLGGSAARLRAPRGPGGRLVRVGAAGTALGGLWLAAGRAAFNLEFLAAIENVDEATALRLLEAPDSPAFLALVLMLPCLLLGPLLMAVGVARAGHDGWLPAALWIVGIGLFLGSEFTVKPGEVAGIALAASALALIGRTLDREVPDRARAEVRA